MEKETQVANSVLSSQYHWNVYLLSRNLSILIIYIDDDVPSYTCCLLSNILLG